MNYQTLREQLILDESMRLHPYVDCCAKSWRDCTCAEKGKLTIGVGRNLDDIGISKDEATILEDNDIKAAIDGLDSVFPWWRGMSDIRQHVIINMCFNLGISRLSGFKLALMAMEAGNYDEAANQMMNSKWFNQVGARAIRLVSLMRNGK